MLIVDDDSDLREVLKDIFLIKGYDVETAGNGPEAFAAVKKKYFDIALIDLIMEGPNGLDILKKIRELNQDISCFMMTAYPSDDNIKQANVEGVCEIFKKPFDVDVLENIFEAEISKKKK